MHTLLKYGVIIACAAIVGLGLGVAYLQVTQPVDPTPPDDHEGNHMSPLGVSLTVPPLAVAWLWHRFITRTHDFTPKRGNPP